MTAAPLKFKGGTSVATSGTAYPRSHDRGPIEEHPKATGECPRDGPIRGHMTAAPLKSNLENGNLQSGVPIRGHMTAAPLKGVDHRRQEGYAPLLSAVT